MHKETRRKKKMTTWFVRGCAVLGIAFSLWTVGGVVLSATGCKVGVYDCVGELYLYLGNVGIGTPTPGQKLSVAGTIESTAGGYKFPDGTTQTTAVIVIPHGKQTFTASGTFTVPTGVTTVWVSMSGGGGGGGSNYNGSGYSGGGGGGGGGIIAQQLNITGATSITVTVGGGGAAGTSGGNGGAGGNTSFGAYYTVSGGGGGVGPSTGAGGAGGSSGTYGKNGVSGGKGGASVGGGGAGGDSLFGSGGTGGYNGLPNGSPGKSYGGGGGGNWSGGAGSAGAPGFVLVEW